VTSVLDYSLGLPLVSCVSSTSFPGLSYAFRFPSLPLSSYESPVIEFGVSCMKFTNFYALTFVGFEIIDDLDYLIKKLA
jgi:hypothetical protein